jgi:tetratricopeptide (TPR) repeat protein
VKCIAMAGATALLVSAGLCLSQPSGGQKQGAAAPSAAVQSALMLEQQGKFPEAQAVWEGVVKSEPRNALAFAHLGLLEAREEHYPEAIAAYRKARALSLETHKAIPQLNLNLGLALFKSGSFQDAAKVFESELRTHPAPADAQRLTILAGMSYYGAHEYKEAIPYLKEATAVDRKNLPLRLTLGHCYLWTRQVDATLAVYREILTIDPDSAEADMIAGEALDEKGDRSGAEQQFQAAEKANPKEPNVHFCVAYLRWAQKRFDEAVPEFKAELENDPGNYEAMIYLGDTYVQENRLDLAREVLEHAVQSQGDVALIHLDLGIVYMEAGNKDLAIQELSRAVALEPDNVNAHFRLAQIYRSMGKTDEAKAEFVKSRALKKKAEDDLFQKISSANGRPGEDAKPAQVEKP